MKVIYPPNNMELNDGLFSIFLAGSIEMGAATDWQQKVINRLQPGKGLKIFNPRRKDWDSSWEQSIRNKEFTTQVNWEMDGIEHANLVFFYFDPTTKSPITLEEFGFTVEPKLGPNMIVVCPDGFWRKGNVDVMYKRYRNKIPHNSLDEGLNELVGILNSLETDAW